MSILKFSLRLTIFSAVLLVLHHLVYIVFPIDAHLYFPLWAIYAFNFIMVFGMFSIIKTAVSRGHKKTYSLFSVLTILKMILAVLFLIPLFTGKSEIPIIEILNFFAPYFCFLIFEIFALNKFLKGQKTN